MFFKGLAVITLVLLSGALVAETNSSLNLPLRKSHGPSLQLAIESVGDRVDYSPNLEGGGFASPENRSRFGMQALSIDWPVNRELSITAGFANYTLNSLRDSINAYQVRGGANQTLFRWSDTRRVAVGVSLQHSFSDELNKNSFTHTDQGIITSANINRPSDLEAAVSLLFESNLSEKIEFQSISKLGFQRATYQSINGRASSSGGCDIDFNLGAAGGTLSQTAPCGVVQSFEQVFPDDQSLLDGIGIQPRSELQYTSWYLEQGLSMARSLGNKSSLHSSLTVRYFMRSEVDDTSEGFQHNPVRLSQVFSVGVRHRFTPKFRLALTAFYRKAPFLDKVPFLYSRYTAERFEGSTPSFEISAAYSLF